MSMADLPYNDYKLITETKNVVVVGSGAAGFNALLRLDEFGVEDIALITESINIGTSRNAGSDKQTYYKLSLTANEQDSFDQMARVFYDGYAMDGDLAKVESVNSLRCFYDLISKHVPFPYNEYGEYTGYKTDHDPNHRGTSLGPYTSKKMTECLQYAAMKRHLPLFDHQLVIKIFTEDNRFKALLTYHKKEKNFRLIFANACIFATGGPGAIYSDNVYPNGQHGMTGICFEAGITGQNITHFQYGMASRSPKWNVSGTYMQALPRFFSRDASGKEYDFLESAYEDPKELYKNIFLKGYQWPFDVQKINGSSRIDQLVYQETIEKNRSVYLDFRENPYHKPIDFNLLDPEVFNYLSENQALLEKPIDRLQKMNPLAYSFYKEHHVDLAKMPLEIAVCAQHNNGGLKVDSHYETTCKNFFACGEVAGTHGIYRPGGSALNAGQVGGLRAAQRIAKRTYPLPHTDDNIFQEAKKWLYHVRQSFHEESSLYRDLTEVTTKMSAYGGFIRQKEPLINLNNYLKDQIEHFFERTKAKPTELPKLFVLRDVYLSQYVYTKAMIDYFNSSSLHVGGCFYQTNTPIQNQDTLPKIQEITLNHLDVAITWRNPRPIPETNTVFESLLSKNTYY